MIFKYIQIFQPTNNKFISLLRKDVYPYKYMDDSEKFNETSLPKKKRFLQSLMQITHTQKEFVKIWK